MLRLSALRNVLLILTDQHSAAAAGYAGDPVARTPHLDALDAWLDNTMKLPGATFRSREALNEVATGYLRSFVDNWAHYTVDAGRCQLIQRENDAKLLGGEMAAQPAMAAMKTQFDTQLKDTYERFKNTRLVRDTLCQ